MVKEERTKTALLILRVGLCSSAPTYQCGFPRLGRCIYSRQSGSPINTTRETTRILKQDAKMFGLDTTTYNSLVIALGGLVYGVDTGIVATTIAHDSFKQYMYGTLEPRTALTGAIVSTYYAGNCVGSFGSGALMDKWGRKSLVFGSTLFAIVGTAIQTGAVNVGMMIAGRTLAGLATGALLTIVPIYIAELSPPENRAVLVALKGLLTAIGYLLANWIGYAGSFAVGHAQWRIPLAMQLPPAMLLLLLIVFLPNSPRWRKCTALITVQS